MIHVLTTWPSIYRLPMPGCLSVFLCYLVMVGLSMLHSQTRNETAIKIAQAFKYLRTNTSGITRMKCTIRFVQSASLQPLTIEVEKMMSRRRMFLWIGYVARWTCLVIGRLRGSYVSESCAKVFLFRYIDYIRWLYTMYFKTTLHGHITNKHSRIYKYTVSSTNNRVHTSKCSAQLNNFFIQLYSFLGSVQDTVYLRLFIRA